MFVEGVDEPEEDEPEDPAVSVEVAAKRSVKILNVKVDENHLLALLPTIIMSKQVVQEFNNALL